MMSNANQAFELIVGEANGEILNGDVPVRWCVTPELVKELDELGVVDPHVLLVSATTDYKEMQRQLVPITELMSYVRFTRAGKQKLFGFIVSGKPGRKVIQDAFMRKCDGDYVTMVLSQYLQEAYTDLDYVAEQTEVNVHIPEDVFGKEPSAWMKWYVNLWHTNSSKVVDECHYRQRLIMAFTLKIVPVILYVLFLGLGRSLFVTAATLAGYWEFINYKQVLRVFKYPSLYYNVMDGEWPWERKFTDSKFNLSYKDRDNDTIPIMASIGINPFVITIITVIVFLSGGSAGHVVLTGGWAVAALGFLDVFIWILLAFVYYMKDKIDRTWGYSLNKWLRRGKRVSNAGRILIAIWFIVMVAAVAYLLSLSLNGAMTIVLVMLEGAIAMAAVAGVLWYFSASLWLWFDNIFGVSVGNNDMLEVRELLCPRDKENLIANVRNIPTERKTIRLWYLDTKNKFCKPMQR